MNTMEKDKKYAAIFGNNPDISLDERTRVIRELEKIGSLTFKIQSDEEGWTAQCDEIPSIVTGNTNPSPTQNEIESQVRDAIFAAFNVKIQNSTELGTAPYKFQYYSINGNHQKELVASAQ